MKLQENGKLLQIIIMVQSANLDPYFSFKCAIASFFANYTVGIFHPLQILKTRFQSHDGKAKDNLVPKYQGIIKGIKDIHKSQGLYGLFKGIHLSTFTAAAANSLFFWIYEKRKLDYEQTDFKIMSATAIASLQASFLTTFLTQPFWVIKTRVLLNTDPNISEFQNVKSKTIQIWKHHNIRGFYLGLVLNLMLSLTGAVQMYIYEGSKIVYDYLLKSSGFGEKNFICGSISKLISTVVTYPLTTIRTRVQQNQYVSNSTQKKYQGSWDITKKIAKQEGFVGFFKGLWPNLIRGIPHRGVYFYFYQLFKKWLLVNPQQKSKMLL